MTVTGIVILARTTPSIASSDSMKKLENQSCILFYLF